MITRSIPFIVFLFQSLCCFSQSLKKDATAKRSDEKAWELRNYTVSTCMKSERVEGLVQKTWNDKKKKDSLDPKNHFFIIGNIKLSDADFQSLTPLEKFVYAHQNPESYMQVCGLYDMAKDMSMIYANIPYLFDGDRMSERQEKSLLDNRDSTMVYLGKCLDFQSHIPLGYKKTILEINAWEFIPSILMLEDKMYKGDMEALKDPYVYSVLMVLMKEGEFKDFKKTVIFKTLYSPDSGYREKMKFTTDLREQIRDLSEKFYLQKTSETK
jgi:hypothetical protein